MSGNNNPATPKGPAAPGTPAAPDVPAVPDVGLGDKPPLALGKEKAGDVAGNLKVHVKLALEIEINITARIKGDIAIGIL